MRSVIVAALGPSAAATRAWAEATIRARRAHGQLVAIRAAPRIASDAAALVREAWGELQRRRGDLCGQATLDVVMARGELVTELILVATADQADLIVVGADMWPEDELALAIAHLVAHTTCGVLVVRDGPSTSVIVGGVDQGTASRHVAAALAEEAAACHQGFGFLVCCIEQGVQRAAAAIHLRALRRRHPMIGAELVAEGQPGARLVEAAADVRAELLIVGRGRASAQRAAGLGPVTEHVVRTARCSVLVLPSPAAPPWWSIRVSARPQA